MHPMTEKKEQLKSLAKKIKDLKSIRKEKDVNWEIYVAKRDFRYEHIAYCLVRGRTYEQIEQPRDNNKPNWYIINRLKDTLKNQVDEANEYWRLQKLREVSNG
jgi:hypothetical protein